MIKALIIFALAVGVGMFQNCGRMESNIDETMLNSNSSLMINYFYKSAPTFYVDTQLLSQSAGSRALNEFKVMVNIGLAEGTAVIVNYEIAVTNLDNATVCPRQIGRLMPGQTLIQFDCKNLLATTEIKVNVKASSGAHNENYDFHF